MPKKEFDSAAQPAPKSPLASAFAQGPEAEKTNAFALVNGSKGWRLADRSTPKKMRPQHADDDFDEAPSLAAVMAWMGGMPKGDEEIYNAKQEILRQEKTPADAFTHELAFFMQVPDSSFQKVMRADDKANHLIAEANNSALTSASWMHNLILQEHLEKRRRLQNRFDNLAYKGENRGAQVFTSAQLKSICQGMVRKALAPAPAPAPSYARN